MSIVRTNKNDPFIVNERIIEWDMKSANTSLMRYYRLLDPKKIEKLENMEKDKREVAVGKLGRKDKDFMKALEAGFTDIINEFIEANELEETDIVSIKKDAIFVRSREIHKSDFGDSVHFIPKNKYDGCLLLPRYEFYHNNDGLDVKGISDDVLPLHEDGILVLIKEFFKMGTVSIAHHRFLKEYIDAYKKRELPYNAYREFDSSSQFRVYNMAMELMTDNIDEDMIPYVNISFNYINIILPLLKILMKMNTEA